MATDFLPRTDEGLLSFATPMSAKITLTPTVFGVTSSIATTLATKVSDYSAALLAAQDPATRGPGTIQQKNTTRDDLRSYIRSVARQIQGTITVTDDQRQELGLTIPAPKTPIPPPTDVPEVDVVSRAGTGVRLRVHDGSGTGRAKPKGVRAINIYSHIGPTPPMEIGDWVSQGQSTRTFIDLEFPATTAPGTLIWLTAQYVNPRSEAGPGCAPISFVIAGGEITEAA